MPLLGSIIKSAIELRSKIPLDSLKPKPHIAQKHTLKKLLRKASITAFGEHYNFSELLKEKNLVSAFQQKVPVSDYNLIFRKWWYRSLNGEPFVCWPGRIKYFALSSGTSEASSKYIPVTSDMLKAIQKTSVRQIFSLARYEFSNDFFEKGILMLGGSTHLQYNGTYYEGDLSGITAGNIPFWFQHFYKPGKRISKERNWPTKLEEIIKNAPNWDIGVICGVPAWIQILLERIIQTYNLNNIHDIWPNFSIYVHGGVSLSPYVKGFEKLLGKPITYIETYLASEGFIAYQSRPNTSSMELVLDNGLFFEFVTFNEENFDDDNNIKSTAKAITIEDVEEGKEYALLLSSCAGAWRYLVGDTIKFTSKERSEIVITGRTKHFLSLCGEHLSQENMNRAIQMLEDEFNIEVREFTVAGIKYESMFAHKWYIGTDNQIDANLVKTKIDEYLKILNDDYRVERIAAIKEIFAEIVPTEVFYSWMKQKGKEGAQNKFPRVLKNEKLTDWENFLTEYKKSQT
ncbi:MAG TPA: GH3 auxin-responsive promoter family protein [Bacteroidales bacterium]|nr:GH3 auxin-responsive promoter family protein [Bacteroidales bacterium]HPS16801.1 GH3 auxin-responsive promoter family protein [Bacteroidales bacterium]